MMFWIGLLIGVAILGLVLWLRSRKIKVAWYEWLVGTIGILLLLLTVNHYFGALKEFVPKAANYGLLFFGLPAIILLVISSTLVWRRVQAGK